MKAELSSWAEVGWEEVSLQIQFFAAIEPTSILKVSSPS